MKIGDLSAATDTSVESIRYYEREGLLPAPSRTQGNYREYDDAHAQRLQFIRRCRALDMTLDEVRALLRFIDLPQGDCAGVNALLDEHLGHVRQRIAELRRLEKELGQLRALCDAPRAANDCGILRGLAQRRAPRRATASAAHKHDDVHRPKAAAR
jgi:Cd(II)/Pb(II)-responsive transcriptional regulator